MPVYIYRAKDSKKSCEYCRNGFEVLQKAGGDPVEKCPECGAAVVKVISSFSVGASQSSFDDRAKQSGFHKLQKRDKGTYEKMY